MIRGLDFTGISVVFFCHDGSGKILMNKRSVKCRDEQGKWDIGGGALKFGESAIDAVKREIKEEYCADVLECEFLGYRDVHRTVDGKKSHWLALDFKVRIQVSTIKNGDPQKIDEIAWFSPDALPSPLHSQLGTFLDNHKSKLK